MLCKTLISSDMMKKSAYFMSLKVTLMEFDDH